MQQWDEYRLPVDSRRLILRVAEEASEAAVTKRLTLQSKEGTERGTVAIREVHAATRG